VFLIYVQLDRWVSPSLSRFAAEFSRKAAKKGKKGRDVGWSDWRGSLDSKLMADLG